MTENITIVQYPNNITVTEQVNTITIASQGVQGPSASTAASAIYAASAGYATNSASLGGQPASYYYPASSITTASVAYANNSASSLYAASAASANYANLSGSATYSASLTSPSPTFSGLTVTGILTAGQIQNTPITVTTTQPTAPGGIFYDAALGALSLIDGTVSPQHLGQQLFVQVVNDSSVLLPKGTAVYLNGVQGNRPVATPAIASSSVAHDVVGIIYDDIAAHQQGLVLTQGIIEGIDTRPFTPGAYIYLSASVAGGLTPTEPVYPNYAYVVAQALNSTVNGKLLVEAYAAYNQVNVNGAIQFSDGYRTIGSANATLDLSGNLNVVAASVSGSAVATQAYVTSRGYVTSSGSVAGANNSASLAGIAASSYAQLSSANFTAASVGGNAIATQSYVTGLGYQTSTGSVSYSSSTGFISASNISGSVTSALNSASLAGQPGSYYYPASSISTASVAYATNSGNSTTTSQTNFTTLTLSGSNVATQAYVTGQGYVTSTGSVAGANNSASLGGQPASYYYPASSITSASVAYATNAASATNAGNSTTTSQTNFSALTISSSAVATQAYVTGQGYVTSSGSVAGANNSASLGGVAASGYALLSSSPTFTGTITASGNVVYYQTINSQSGSAYPLALTDANKFVTMTSSAANTITVPAASTVLWQVGTRIDIIQQGAGTTTVSPASGASISYYSPTLGSQASASALTLKARYAAGTLLYTASNSWLAIGNFT